jgi:hypothetical protein
MCDTNSCQNEAQGSETLLHRLLVRCVNAWRGPIRITGRRVETKLAEA